MPSGSGSKAAHWPAQRPSHPRMVSRNAPSRQRAGVSGASKRSVVSARAVAHADGGKYGRSGTLRERGGPRAHGGAARASRAAVGHQRHALATAQRRGRARKERAGGKHPDTGRAAPLAEQPLDVLGPVRARGQVDDDPLGRHEGRSPLPLAEVRREQDDAASGRSCGVQVGAAHDLDPAVLPGTKESRERPGEGLEARAGTGATVARRMRGEHPREVPLEDAPGRHSGREGHPREQRRERVGETSRQTRTPGWRRFDTRGRRACGWPLEKDGRGDWI